MDIMDNVRKKMKEKGLIGKDMASALGISESAFSKWNRGINKPTVKNLMAMAEVLDCPLSDLTAGVMPMTGFSDEAEAKGAANDPPSPKQGDASPNPDEIADLIRTFYEDSKFRALFRARKKGVSPEAFDAMATFILNLKGNDE